MKHKHKKHYAIIPTHLIGLHLGLTHPNRIFFLISINKIKRRFGKLNTDT